MNPEHLAVSFISMFSWSLSFFLFLVCFIAISMLELGYIHGYTRRGSEGFDHIRYKISEAEEFSARLKEIAQLTKMKGLISYP